MGEDAEIDVVENLLHARNAPTAVILTGLATVIRWRCVLSRLGVRIPDDLPVAARLDVTEQNLLERAQMCEGLACSTTATGVA